MSDESEDPALLAERLEAALERIAAAFARAGRAAVPGSGAAARDGIVVGEIAARLDALIAELRASLGEPV